MIPVIIAAAGAVVGGVAVAALSDDDKQPSGEQQTKRIMSESQLPSAVKNKLEKKRRDNSNDEEIDFTEIEKMFAAGKSNYTIKNELQLLELKAKRQRNAQAMNFIANYYHRLGDYQRANKCYEFGCSF